MARLNILLLLAVLGSALFLVHVQYESRQLFTDMHRIELEARRLDTERDRLQVEKRAQATPLRIEKLAMDQLRMRTTTPAITQYVRPDGTVIPPIAAPVPDKPAGARASAQPAARSTSTARRSP